VTNPADLSGLLKIMTNWTTNRKLHTFANKAGIGNKLVTIFARHLDNFIMTHYLTVIYEIRNFRLWTNPAKETGKSFAGMGKNCAMVASPPGQLSG
jgi:hypothetical protein